MWLGAPTLSLPRPRSAALAVALLAVLLCAPVGTFALECEGGGQAHGGIILKTIACDGDPSDWAEILANPHQVTADGDGSSVECALSTDRDCPVDQAGRDMARFTWTYDDRNLYLFQSRYGSLANIQTFFFYMDTGLDRHMGPADFILKVDYYGANRETQVQLFRFYPRDGVTPDPMECPPGDPTCTEGFADGYDMPGFYAPISDPACTLCTPLEFDGGFNAGGSEAPLDGAGFEVFVPWSDMGFEGPRPMYFHVSGTNSAGIILDNCGSPDGRVGTFGFHGVDIEASQAVSTGLPLVPTPISYAHTVKNTGLFEEEAASLQATSSQGLTLEYWDSGASALMARDAGGDGDFSGPGDYLDPAYDTDGDGLPNTPPLPRFDASDPTTVFHMRLDVILEPTAIPCLDETSLFARIPGTPAEDCVRDETTIGNVQLGCGLSLAGTPGSAVDFPHAANHFLVPDRIRLRGVSALGRSLSFYADPAGEGRATGPLMGTDADGDGDFTDPGDTLNPAYDTDGDGYPDTGVLPAGSPFPFVLQVTAAGAVGLTDTIQLEGSTGAANGYARAAVTDDLAVLNRLSLAPEHEVYGASGSSVFLAHRVLNAFSEEDRALLGASVLNGGAPAGWTVRFWSDPNCDGSIADGVLLVPSAPETRPELGPVGANGGSSCFVAELQVPPGAQEDSLAELFLTATSKGDAGSPPAAATVRDAVHLSSLVTCADGTCSLPASAFSTCDTIHARGYSWRAGDDYFVRFRDPGGADRSGLLPVVVDYAGQFARSYALGQDDPAGPWKVQVLDGRTLALVKEVAVAVSALVPAVSGPSAICGRQTAVLEAEAGYDAYLWSPGGETSRVIAVSPGATTDYACTVTRNGSCQAASAPHTLAVQACPNLLRNAEVTQLSPQSPPSSVIFSGGDPALAPGRDDESIGFDSGSPFAHDVVDASPSGSPLIFYEVENLAGDTLRAALIGGRVVLTF